MQNLYLIVSGMSVGIIALLVCKMLIAYRTVYSANLFSLILIGSASYVIQPYISPTPWLLITLQVLSSAVPGLFWLFTVSFFSSKEDGPQLTPFHHLVFLSGLILSIFVCVAHNKSYSFDPLYYIDYLFKTALVLLGLWEVIKNWRVDLVECRRRLRASMAITAGLFLLFSIFNELIYSGENLPMEIAHINTITMALMSLFTGYWILISDSNTLLEAIDTLPKELSNKVVPAAPQSISPIDQTWLDALSQCMEKETYYRNNDLTIRSLSEHLNIPEHHLRRLINQQLGYRNFNEYLNRFRIKEASLRLQDPQQARLPITTIAIESGYASLTTFNKAFKSLKDMTPSEFRRENRGFSVNELTDS